MHRINHIGDWGSQFGALVAEINRRGLKASHLSIHELEQLYKDAKKHVTESKSFQSDAQQTVKLLQDGDGDTISMWKDVCAISRKEFERIYTELDIEDLKERGESFYNPMLAPLVDELLEMGIAEECDGAVVVFARDGNGRKLDSKNDFPLIIRKSDGAFTYDTTDIAALR